ncbi:hypothetical protein V5F38_12170 [Xanthobacter sp. V0B-10]|uniref:hypothetical protein n=1 Tax=Xanthobacter albus TaxID=3119929 RepID=UPI00372840F7
MSIVNEDRLERELDLAPHEIEELVQAGVLAPEPSGLFSLPWNRFALRIWRHQEPALIEGLRHEAASMADNYWVRLKIYRRSVLAGPEARVTLTSLGLNALRRIRLLINMTAGKARNRLAFQAREIEHALDRPPCPRAAE